MRTTVVLLKKFPHIHYYRPKTYYTDKEHEVQFKSPTEFTPLKVGNSVETSIHREAGNTCIQEMFNFMACLKNNDFEQAECSKELQLFNECTRSQRPVQYTSKSKKERKKLSAQPGQKNLTTGQLNDYLKKFPT